MIEWKKQSKANEPTQDGRYLVIFRQGGIVRRWVEDYNTEYGWLLGMFDVEIIAWAPLPDIPDWVIDTYSKPPKQEA